MTIATTPADIWLAIRQEATCLVEQEPILASFYHSTLLKHEHLGRALSYILANKLATESMPAMAVREIIEEAYQDEEQLIYWAAYDIMAAYSRDPAVAFYCTPLLYFKGFLALQAYRIAHWLWRHNRQALALYLQS